MKPVNVENGKGKSYISSKILHPNTYITNNKAEDLTIYENLTLEFLVLLFSKMEMI